MEACEMADGASGSWLERMRSRLAGGSVGDPDVSMALIPPGQSAVQMWDMTESSPLGGAQRRSEDVRGVPVGGQ